MITIKTDSNRDIAVDQRGNFSFVRDIEALKEVCEAYARAARNEMIHKMNKGMPFFEQVFSSQVNTPQFEAAFRARMSEIEQVQGVTSFRATVEENTLKYTAVISTVYGNIEVNNIE